jgi:hypothetical protein
MEQLQWHCVYSPRHPKRDFATLIAGSAPVTKGILVVTAAASIFFQVILVDCP